MYKLIKEKGIRFYIPKESKISKKLPVFYNPQMELGRDICIFIIKKFKPKNILDAMAGTGIRAMRIFKELPQSSITANDINSNAANLIEKNIGLNSIKLKIANEDMNILLLKKEKFDYIDIDPFGSPIKYISPAVSALSDNGILAVTATDLGSLYGKYIKSCRRKYNAIPLNCMFKKENAIRILIHHLQTVAAKYNKALMPIFCHSSNHYLRVYLKNNTSKKETDSILKKSGYLHYCPKCLKYETSRFNLPKICCRHEMKVSGPIWLGRLWDENLTKGFTLIRHLREESNIQTIGYYELNSFYKKYKKNPSGKIENLIKKIKAKSYQASRTHFSDTGIRSSIPHKELLKHLFAFS
ncbi:MAG: tRNA (guanine(26)-N(2))-dimethyltransferase [Nanoarchaeota archaeon]|nr:tRNA (guanine(26)-N(2))-dimethyltransferase [Nanoarchaeota archaeon]